MCVLYTYTSKDDVRGNFKDLAILLAKYSPPLSCHLTEVQIRGKHTQHFVSWNRQNQLILAIATNICNTIKNKILNAKFFALSLDTTFDVSRKEQLSLVIRYINKSNGVVCERLITVRETLMTTGQHLFTVLDDICKDMCLDWKTYLIGQSYDGTASMRGAYNGLQAIVKEHNSSATYVWCWAHKFNLVIVDAVSSCSQARDLFGTLETLYDYIGSSKKRVGLYSASQRKIYPGKPLRRLKRVDTTRWTSHSAALCTVFDTYDSIIDILEDLQHDSDRISSVKASSLINYLLSERFILTGFIFKQIFELTSPLTKFLQGVNIDLLGASEYVKLILEKIHTFRSEHQLKKLVEDKNTFIASKANELSFTPLSLNRIRKKKIPGENIADEQIKKRLKEVAEQSNLPTDAFDGFEMVYGKFVKADDLRQKIHKTDDIDEEIETSDNTENDIDPEDLDLATNQGNISTVFKVCHQNDLKEVFPSIYIALCICLTLPVSSSSPERAFSKLKLIKSRLRSSMGEDRLESLMLISCEKDINIDNEESSVDPCAFSWQVLSEDTSAQSSTRAGYRHNRLGA
ncbi:zinc finger MYM-type protein 1-like [Acyrthosiphon pisum]|uniref:Zinc finger MYM-type protein 1-like n=1 Tax=Acyrthosiphon pisum TaxID=7029 RepID=A0A8R2AXX6_ACYPI|nr:zinc finger MYM-type protein 1-like [Acyrthosiphon pisum]|eukprot:XP_008178520.1 PREDICTED: zinc finger MYM-type protein 1-like [Acyrthosiphon pisum]